LFHSNRPVAYAFCRIDAEIITYTLVGYDPSFAKVSPGTVLLVLIIERLFAERRFRLFDFGGMASDYKAFFATGGVDYVKVFWFPINLKYLMLVLTHYLVLQTSRGAAWLKSRACTGSVSGARGLARLYAQLHRLRGARTIEGARPPRDAPNARAQQLRP
jgi:CelD/BcsL family acetyltransferase involved in cellulose biosynthesis